MLSPPFFVKKLTVKGIIGKTHGVNNANKPPRKPKPKILHSDFPCCLTSDAKEDTSSEQLPEAAFISSTLRPYKILLASLAPINGSLKDISSLATTSPCPVVYLNVNGLSGLKMHCSSSQVMYSILPLISKLSSTTSIR